MLLLQLTFSDFSYTHICTCTHIRKKHLICVRCAILSILFQHPECTVYSLTFKTYKFTAAELLVKLCHYQNRVEQNGSLVEGQRSLSSLTNLSFCLSFSPLTSPPPPVNSPPSPSCSPTHFITIHQLSS